MVFIFMNGLVNIFTANQFLDRFCVYMYFINTRRRREKQIWIYVAKGKYVYLFLVSWYFQVFL